LAMFGFSLALAGCRKTFEWHQKLIVQIDTPQGVKTGSAVVSEKVWSGQLPMSASAAEYKITGEATVVEVAPGKYLFALLGNTEELAVWTWKDSLPGNDPDVHWSTIQSLRESKSVPRARHPLLVTFTDITDPKSVKEVTPDTLAFTFGEGYSLKSITLEITDEAVTVGKVEQIIPWIGDPNVMEKPNWLMIPVGARELLGNFLTDYAGAQVRFLKEKTK
jgi:hypothetical protein